MTIHNHMLQPGKKARLWLAGMGTAILIFGMLITWWTVRNAEQKMRGNLSRQVTILAQSLNHEKIRSLSGAREDLEKPEYHQLKQQLATIRQARNDCRFAYLLGRKANGTIFFFVDNEPDDSKDYSRPGQEYLEASEGIRRIFETKAPEIDGPVTDRRGTWITALIPINDPQTGALIAVFGMGIDARRWRLDIAADAVLPVAVTLILLIGLGTALLSTRLLEASPRPVLQRLMLPLTAGLVLVSFSFASYIISEQSSRLDESSRALLTTVSIDLQRSLAEQSRSLAMLQNTMIQNADLLKALKDRDRQRLLANYSSLFSWLRTDYDITHFYFMDPQRVCLLRLHSPEKYGDRIERSTAREAESTGRTASGIELGPLGTFTLRVVQPVFDGKTLIGYLELGREIEDMLADIHKRRGIELAVTIRKKALNRQTWENGMKMLERDNNWERFSQDALIYSSLTPFPAEAEQFVGDSSHIHFDTKAEIRIKDASWEIMNAPLHDTSGVEVGDLMVLRDISELKAEYHRMVSLISGGTMVIMAGLLGFLFLLLRRTDAGIRDQQAALQESERKYHTLFDSATDAIFILDLNGNFIDLNRSAYTRLGYTKQEMLSLHISRLDPPEFAARVPERLVQISRLGAAVFESAHIRKDGSIMPVEINSRLLDYEGRQVYFSIIRDISDRKLAEEKIRQNLKEKETLLREIHHRVKNNMAVISGLLDLQSDRIKDVTMKELFDESRQRIKSMALVHEKLYNTENLLLIDFSDYINSILRDLISSYHKEGREILTKISVRDIRLSIESAIPCGLIINELITNAMKHAFPGKTGGEITISFTKSANSYTLTVQDNGIGLPEGFDLTKTNTLGLQLVEALTRQLKGSLKFQSGTTADHGTAVIITFSEKDGGKQS